MCGNLGLNKNSLIKLDQYLVAYKENELQTVCKPRVFS